MTFKTGQRRGRLWSDIHKIVEELHEFDFNNSAKSERAFEHILSGRLGGLKDLNHSFSQQTNYDQQVASSKFFGKNHRPDMSLADDGVAIELKYVNSSLDSARSAIGQGYVYRTTYKFVILILVMDKRHQDVYESELIDHQARSDTGNIFYKLADDNIFTIIKPNFKPKNGLGHTISYFQDD